MKNVLQQSEMQIVKSILEHLAYWGVLAWRTNSGMTSGMYKGKAWFVKGAPTGTPDIIGVLGYKYGKHYGRMIAIEVKKPGNTTSDAQDRRIAELQKYGAYAFVAYSVDEVKEQLERLKK